MRLIYEMDEMVIVAMKRDDWVSLTTTKPEQLPSAWLGIPHLCQNGEGADARRNDCGAACVAMCVNGLQERQRPLTVDEVAVRFQKSPNKYMRFGDLLEALRYYGVAGEYHRPVTIKQMTAWLAAGRPLIALVKYPRLPEKVSDFRGSHFVVVYGYADGVFVYHDPLAKQGEQSATADDLLAAMSEFDTGENLPCQVVVVG